MVNVHVDIFNANAALYTSNFDVPVNVATPNGNLVLIRAEYLKGLHETLLVEANPKLKSKILESMKAPRNEFEDLNIDTYDELVKFIESIDNEGDV